MYGRNKFRGGWCKSGGQVNSRSKYGSAYRLNKRPSGIQSQHGLLLNFREVMRTLVSRASFELGRIYTGARQRFASARGEWSAAL